MQENRIDPSRVTKPIQLLSAWLVGLISIDISYLAAARSISHPDWASGVLVVAAILNVPVFLVCLFLLQTRFRPEMQEDSFYATYLEKRISAETRKAEPEQSAVADAILEVAAERVVEQVISSNIESSTKGENLYTIKINDFLEQFSQIVTKLSEENLQISETFGSTSKSSSKPAKFVLSSTDDVPLDVFKKVYRICSDLGLEAIAKSTTKVESTMYIGGYGYKTGGVRIVDRTPELDKLINSSKFTKVALSNILK